MKSPADYHYAVPLDQSCVAVRDIAAGEDCVVVTVDVDYCDWCKQSPCPRGDRAHSYYREGCRQCDTARGAGCDGCGTFGVAQVCDTPWLGEHDDLENDCAPAPDDAVLLPVLGRVGGWRAPEAHPVLPEGDGGVDVSLPGDGPQALRAWLDQLTVEHTAKEARAKAAGWDLHACGGEPAVMRVAHVARRPVWIEPAGLDDPALTMPLTSTQRSFPFKRYSLTQPFRYHPRDLRSDPRLYALLHCPTPQSA